MQLTSWFQWLWNILVLLFFDIFPFLYCLSFFPFLLLLSYNWFTHSFDISGPGMDHIVSTCSSIVLPSDNAPILFLAWIPEVLFDLPHYFLCSNTSADQPGSFLFRGIVLESPSWNYLVQKKRLFSISLANNQLISCISFRKTAAETKASLARILQPRLLTFFFSCFWSFPTVLNRKKLMIDFHTLTFSLNSLLINNK